MKRNDVCDVLPSVGIGKWTSLFLFQLIDYRSLYLFNVLNVSLSFRRIIIQIVSQV